MELTITEKVPKTIALNMIVKNESHIIEKTLQNLCEYIPFDYWVICDTGSTDGTQDLIKKFFKAKNIDGELHQCEWKDFGHNRTEALNKAFNKTDYLLIFDADDSIQGDFTLPTEWNHDSYFLKFGNSAGGETVYKRVLLINNRKKYAFRGVLHEFIVGLSDDITEKTIEGDYYLVSGREGSRSQDPNKYLNDACVLEKGFSEETGDIGLKNRYAFYCGQSYKDAGCTDQAIHWFLKALSLPLWVQEKYYSCYQLGYLYEKKNETEKAIHYWLKTSQYDPERIEGVVAACNKYKELGLNEIAVSLYSHYANYAEWTTNLHEKLFVEVSRYQQELEYHCSIAAGYTRQKECGYKCCKKILIHKQQPLHILQCTIHNLQFYKKFIREDPDSLELFYAVDILLSQVESTTICFDIWLFLFMHNREKLTYLPKITTYPCNKDKPFIFLSFTTCKRLDLFKQTMQSILNHWGDYNKIEYWFCVDDNSSQEDRTVMQTTYPWIDYYMKTSKEKGHRESMNIIWDKLNQLKPTYWIHMEDDFLFHRKYNYVEQGIHCLQKYKDKNVKQVLFNRGYGETIEDYSITSYLPLDEEFSLHDHKQGNFSTRNCHYWPYYSFRPSIIEVESILKLGNYDSHNQFFEMDYANRWNDAGYKSAFLNFITNRHIGRLTSQRNNKELPNAYELNNEGQFERITPFIKIVNLERRADRKKGTIEKLAEADCYKYTFIKATDGISLTSTHEIKTLFKENDFGNRKGVIGCALSHYYLWKSLIEDEKHDFYLIMEDDFTLCEGFKEKIEGLKTDMKNKEIIFLGYHMFAKEREKVSEIYDCSSNNVQVSKLNQTIFIGGTFSYSINTNGARHLIDYIEKNGIQHGIDYVIGKLNNEICYETKPHLCFSVWSENEKKIDSDIQYDYTSLDFTEPYIHIINLERRKDRKLKMIENLDENNITNYEFFKAFDGTIMVGTHILKQLFEGNDFDNNRGAIGCAMSHLTLWKQLLHDDDNDFYLILEDDIEFTDDFSENFDLVGEFDQKDIIFLGYSMKEAERNKIDISNTTLQLKLNKLNKTRYIGGFFSYLINKNGAKKLVDYIDKNGIKHGIDYLIKKIDTLDCYEVSPQLTFTKWNEDSIVIDSDIQGVYTKMEFPKNEFIFIQGLDQIGNDLYHQRASIEGCIQRSDKDEKCVGFNTLGFFKDKIEHLTSSPYFGEEDGIYIKKEHYEKYQLIQKKCSKHEKICTIEEVDAQTCISPKKKNDVKPNINYKRVKMLCNWCSSEQLCKEWSTMCEEGPHWKDIEMTSDDENIDYYIIINKPQKGATYNPKKTLVFQMEPWIYNATKNWGVRTWGKWSVPDEKKFLYVGKHKNHLNNVQWQIKIPDIIPEERENKAMTFLSAKNFDWGHKKRIEFLKKLEDRNKSQLKEPMNIAFWDNSLCERGSTASLFDYAFYNEKILGNKSYIFYDQNEPGTKKKIIEKFKKHFIVHQTNDFKEVDDYLLKYKITHIYIIKWGKLDTRISKVAKNCIHCVFDCSHPHGDIYASISPWVEGNDGKFPVVPHMINLPKHNRNMRQKLNIPLGATVFGGYGGRINFSIKFVQKVVYNMAKKYSHIYFLFANFNKFCADLPNIIHLPMITDLEEKVEFINTIDANLWARQDGEVMSLSMGEFSTLNKPIIAMKIGYRGHVQLLGDKAIWYSNENDLTEILLNFNPEIERKKDWNAYKDYTPEKVMDIFQKEFLSESLIDIYGRENYHSLSQYKGPPKDDKKENHYVDYKYCFAVENNSERNYATEKIWEPILCECLTFYWGCPGLEKHINEKAFVRLNITDFEGSLAIIQQAIKEDWWSQRIDIIRQEKQRLINELGFFPRLREIITQKK